MAKECGTQTTTHNLLVFTDPELPGINTFFPAIPQFLQGVAVLNSAKFPVLASVNTKNCGLGDWVPHLSLNMDKISVTFII